MGLVSVANFVRQETDHQSRMDKAVRFDKKDAFSPDILYQASGYITAEMISTR